MSTSSPQPHERRRRGSWLQAWFPSFLMMGIIFYLSSLPGVEIPHYFKNDDKVAHFTVYFLLGLCNGWAATVRGRSMFGAFGWAVIYGASDEMHQHFVPGRTMDPLDWLTDACGAATALLLMRMLRSRRPNRSAVPGEEPAARRPKPRRRFISWQ